MKRKALEFLDQWYHKSNAKPLILRGPRQAGKSTLVRLFCEQHNINLIELDFETVKLREIENDTSFSIKKVLQEIELLAGKKIDGPSLLLFDEVQQQPKVINRLRYFYEKRPDLRVVAAGSLLEVTMDAARFSMPVGRVEYYHLGPMTFTEFLLAKGEEIFLEQFNAISLQDGTQGTWIDHGATLLKEYYYTGGMPEAIQCWIDGGDQQDVREVHHSLIQTYRDDIPKYAKHNEYSRVMDVFEYAVANPGKKVVFSDVAAVHSRSVKAAIDLLAKAGVIIKVTFNYCNGLPLSAGTSPADLKLFFLDIGLYNALHETRWKDIFTLPSDRLLTKGAMAEQFIAQHLKYMNETRSTPELYYWLNRKRKGAAEVDFIHSRGGEIFPIEVKAGKTGKIKSLWKYIEEKNPRFVVKFDLMERKQRLAEIHHKVPSADSQEELSSNLVGLPLFEIENLEKYLDEATGGSAWNL